MARKEGSKQLTGAREHGEELERFLSENGLSMNEALNRGLDLLMLDSIRSKAPDQAAYVEEFEILVNKMLVFYRQALERSLTADDRARADVKSQLEGMSSLADTNSKLIKEKSELIEEKTKLESVVKELKNKVEKLEEEIGSSKSLYSDIEKLKKKCADLSQEKVELLVKHNEEISKLQQENFSNILKVVAASK